MRVKKQLELFEGVEKGSEVAQLSRVPESKLLSVAAGLTPEAERLLAKFEVVAEAPGGVKRLRELILELAVRGRLVQQDPKDEPATALIRQVMQDRDPSESPKQPLTNGSDPMSCPSSWVVVPLGELLTYGPRNGYSPKAVTYPTKVKSLTLSATTSGSFDGRHSKFIDENVEPESELWLSEGDLLIQRSNTIDYVGTTAVYHGPSQEFIYPDLMMKMRVSKRMSVDYVDIALKGSGARSFMRSRASGTAGNMPKINQGVVASVPIPVPPLAEQKRIVAKIDELMKLCDDLEARQTKQRETAGRLTRAALDALTSAEGPEELATSWRRVAGSFDTLLNRPESVQELKASVLELAVRGRLVSQDPRNESADYLLNRILTRRMQALGPRAIPQEPPDGLPALTNGWCWASLDALLVHLRNGISTAPVGDSGVPILRISAVRPNQVNVSDVRFLPGSLSDYAEFEIAEGELLFTRYSGNAHYVGICGVVPKLPQSTVHPDKLIRGIVCPGLLEPRFVALAVNVGESRRRIDECARTTAGQVGISGKHLKGIPIPVAPLAEQKRIVAKVDELMKLCDALEDALRRAEDTAKNLADAIVAELLA